MLVSSIFFFSHDVFKRFLIQGCYKSGFCGDGLKEISIRSNGNTLEDLDKCWFYFFFAVKELTILPDDKILDQTKLKAFADEKLDVTKMIISVFERMENIVGKGEIACTSNFSFSHNVFKRLLSQMCQKLSLCGNGFTLYQTTKFQTWGNSNQLQMSK